MKWSTVPQRVCTIKTYYNNEKSVPEIGNTMENFTGYYFI